MPASWVELRDYAKAILNSDPCEEVQVRCSISRAYYSAFHAVEPLCRVVPSTEPPDHGPSGLGHRQVSQRMRDFNELAKLHKGLSSTVMEARRLALTYRQALEARRHADYHLGEEVDAEAARLQLLRVHDLLTFAVHTKTTFDRLGVS